VSIWYRALAHEVHLPKDFVCRDCTIRLLRQASEWGKNYMFWSCADVDIIPSNKKYPLRVFVCSDCNLTNNNLWKIGPEYRETCSGHGKDIAGRCRCSPLYSGHKCQYRDECSEDKDCGRHGKCFHLEGATSFPKRQCFCEMGWFGPLCNKRKCLSLRFFFLKHDISIHHCVCHNVRYGMTYGSSRLTLDARTNDQLLLPQQVHLI